MTFGIATAAGAGKKGTAADISGVTGAFNGRHDIGHTIEFYRRRYVEQLADFRTLDADAVVADIGCGSGWLAVSFALHTPARVIAVDPDAERLAFARALARRLDVEDRIEWRAGSITELPLADREADVVFCVEVLEHVSREKKAPREIVRICADILVVTTPNLWFPVVAHDTRLPFCHMLPILLRQKYAALAGRLDSEDGNKFWSPPALVRALRGMTRQSDFLQYASFEKYLAAFPHYVPYDNGYWDHGPGRLKYAYYRAVASLGRAGYPFMPNLAGVYQRATR